MEMLKKSLIIVLIFILLLFSIASASAQPEQLAAFITEQQINDILEQAKRGAFFTNPDALYYSEFGFASVCHGGSESIRCAKRAIRLVGNYYTVANPTAALGIGGAHYLSTKTDDYLVVKLLGELWFIKPRWNNSEQCYFEVWKWTPGENFFDDGSYNLSVCAEEGSAIFPKSEDWYKVDAYENSCGIVFNASCRKASLLGNDIGIKDINISSRYFEELKTRAQNRENQIVQTNECGFKIASIRYRGQTYNNPTSLNYNAETAEPMSVSFVIDNSKCTVQQMVFGLWENAEPIGYPPIDLHASSDSINSLNESGSSAIEVIFSDARNWDKKYMAAKVLALPAGSSSALWITTPAVEITFSTGSATGGTSGTGSGSTGGQQPLQDCSVCSSILQCLTCIDLLILQSIP